jgi:hypothetical protein
LGHSNISQTSTFLESTLKGQHDAMRRFDEQRGAGAVQDGENKSGNQGDQVPPGDTVAERKTLQTIN